jgi:antitoxin (DNA-binding transcriptional repressor) of toxin-antitoxin stability system
MTRMTIREVRLHWPKAEAALADGEEIVVTRDAQPVARLLPYVPPRKTARKAFDPEAHMRRIRRFWKGIAPGPSTDALLARDRGE